MRWVWRRDKDVCVEREARQVVQRALLYELAQASARVVASVRLRSDVDEQG